MGQSHTTESASDTDNESANQKVATPINFFGFFGGKRDEYIDSTDSNITVEENRRRRNSKTVRKSRTSQRPSRISEITRNLRPSQVGNNPPVRISGSLQSKTPKRISRPSQSSSPKRISRPSQRSSPLKIPGSPQSSSPLKIASSLQSKDRIASNTSKQSPNRNQLPSISEFNNNLDNKEGANADNIRVISCRQRSCKSTSLIGRKACKEEEETNQHNSGDRLNRSQEDLIPAKESNSDQIVEQFEGYMKRACINKCAENKIVRRCKEHQRTDDPDFCRKTCTAKQPQARSFYRCSENTNGSPSPPDWPCCKCRLPCKDTQRDGNQSPKSSVYHCCSCDEPVILPDNNINGCKNTNGNCDKRSESNGDNKPVQTPSRSATTIESDVMNDYPRYSREPPEREHNACGFTQHNMRTCCRNYCTQKKPDVSTGNKPAHSKYQKFCRPISDSFVANNQNSLKADPVQTRSAPVNAQKSYPPASRVSSEQRSKIPSPPPPPAKDCQNRRIRQCDRKPSPVCENSSDNSKQMYNPHNYNCNKQHYKNSYPYDEPPDTFSYSRETCCSQHCGGYEHCSQHKRCKCQCMCESNDFYPRRNVSDDQLSGCSESTKTDFMNLAYQRTGDYPELVDELENTLSQRNRMRVQKTMEQFEILSRQNKNLDKPIFDDEESCRHHRSSQSCNDCKCPCCKGSDTKTARQTKSKSDNDAYKCRSESLTKRSSYQTNMLPRKPGYVEKVARCMDPNLNRKGGKYMPPPAFSNPNKHRGMGTWTMDSRKGEWVKVGEGSYDFESSYPPLPPRPRSGLVYEDRSNHREYSNRNPDMDHPCSCSKCTRYNH